MDEQEIRTSDDRREYFRLNDSVAFDYRVIDPDELDEVKSRIDSAEPDRFSIAASFAAASQQMGVRLRKVAKSSPSVAEFLKEMDEKINALAGLLAVDELGGDKRPSRALNLSAGGIAFFSESDHQLGELLDVRLVLFPNHIGIRFVGKVVNSISSDRQRSALPHYISVEIAHIRDAERDLLVKHLLQKQTRVLHEQRYQND